MSNLYNLNTHKTYTVEEAKKKLESYCAYQERCHKDVAQKLTVMGMIPEAQDIIIVYLLQNNYLNEERFAKAFVRGKFRIKHWGKYRIARELKQRDISKTLINSALSEISDQEYLEAFHNLASRKLDTMQEKNLQKKRKKLADYLLYRGWENYLVYDKVNELI